MGPGALGLGAWVVAWKVGKRTAFPYVLRHVAHLHKTSQNAPIRKRSTTFLNSRAFPDRKCWTEKWCALQELCCVSVYCGVDAGVCLTDHRNRQL